MPQAQHCPDFDFQQGRWRVQHRRLKARLAGCDDWEEFHGSCEQRPILAGNGNVEDNLLHFPAGDYRAIALRSWDPATARWAIWWLDDRAPHTLDTPVIGSFADGVGTFYADEVQDGCLVRMRFLAAHRHADAALGTGAVRRRWRDMETNWTMDFTRA